MRQIQAIGEPSHYGRTWTIQERSVVQLQARSRCDLHGLAVLHLRLPVGDNLLLAGQPPDHLHSPALVEPQLNLPPTSLDRLTIRRTRTRRARPHQETRCDLTRYLRQRSDPCITASSRGRSLRCRTMSPWCHRLAAPDGSGLAHQPRRMIHFGHVGSRRPQVPVLAAIARRCLAHSS